MKRKNIKTIILIMMISILVNFPSTSYAVNNTNHKLENILVRLQDQSIVKLTMGEYGRAFSAKSNSNLYNFLIGNRNYIPLVGISSGDKYITMGEYGRKFSALKSQGNLAATELTSRAIANSTHNEELALNHDDINDYKVEISSFNIGNLESKMYSNQVETIVPHDMLNKSIRRLGIAFDKPVRITKLNGKGLPQIITDKIIRSGYLLDQYYDEFLFNVGDDYKYSMIFDLSSDSTKSTNTITVVTELGYERDVKIIFTR